MERHYFLTVCLTYVVGLLPLVIVCALKRARVSAVIVRALKRAGVSAELIGGALFVFTRRRVVAVGVRGVEVALKSSVHRMSDIDIMAADVAGRL